MEPITPPYFPIIYVRGYAMFEQDIADTVATPYMGFNDGSMKERPGFDARPKRVAFESPLVRLMKDWGYHDTYSEGRELVVGTSSRLVVIHRYYDQEDPELGTGEHKTVSQAAEALADLILELRDRMYADKDDAGRPSFGVHLVAHSMGGLVCRALLQNPNIGKRAKRFVRRVFTYATPHNGISFRGLRMPGAASWLGLENQFSHREMKQYLHIDRKARRVDTLQGAFPTRQFFCLVGTNHHDYTVAHGGSRWLVGRRSDGLVAIDNARLQDEGSGAAYIHRSHSGHYGIVNSEAGYHNLVNFLFSPWRIDGGLRVGDLPLPPSFDRDRREHLTVQAAFQIEVALTPIGSSGFKLTERRSEHGSAMVLRESQLVSVRGEREVPVLAPLELFTTFAGGTEADAVFNIELAVAPTEYAVDGRVDPRRFIPGEYLFQDTIRVRCARTEDNWTVAYAFTNSGEWGETARLVADSTSEGVFEIPIETSKFSGVLQLAFSRMSDEPIVPGFDATTADKDGPSPGRGGAARRRRRDEDGDGEPEEEKQTEEEEEEVPEPV